MDRLTDRLFAACLLPGRGRGVLREYCPHSSGEADHDDSSKDLQRCFSESNTYIATSTAI